jgi:hypothetical protein
MANDTNTGGRFAASDIAALAASCVAASIAFLTEEGGFTQFSVLISITLSAIVLAAFFGLPRGALESLAVTSALALVMLPAVGFGYECLRGGIDAGSIFAGDIEVVDSRVISRDLAQAWICLTVVFFLLDQVLRLRFRKTP